MSPLPLTKDHANQIMTKKMITLGLTDSVRKGYQLMQENQIRHLPVIDEGGTIIGILSDRDLQRAMTPQKMTDTPLIEFDPAFLARDFMSWPVRTVAANSTVCEVAQLLLDQKISAVLVVGTDQRPRGIITTDDLLKVFITIIEKDSSKFQIKIGSFFDEFFQGNYAV